MKKSKPAMKVVCGQYCPYHKEGKNEELECRGFAVAALLLEEGLKVPPHKAGKNSSMSLAIIETVRKQICSGCPFCASDCDFISTEGKALPCGGFAVIADLLKSGLITVEDLTDIICLA